MASGKSQVQHRFVQIHQIQHGENDIDKVWDSLSSPLWSSIAISNACASILAHVKKGSSQIQETIMKLEPLLLTCRSDVRMSIFLHTLTQLLLWHAKARHQQHEKGNAPLKDLGGTHPFTRLVRKQPSLFKYILVQLDYFTTDTEAISSLQPFFDFVFHTDTGPDALALLNWLAALVPLSSRSVEIRDYVFHYLVGTLNQYTLLDSFRHELSMLDIVLDVLLSDSDLGPLSEDERQEMITMITYQLYSCAVDASAFDRPVYFFLERLERIRLSSLRPRIQYQIIWSALSFLLMTAQTVECQDIIIHLMKDIMDFISDDTLHIAYLPIFQTLSEKTNRDPVLSIITHLHQSHVNPQENVTTIMNEINEHSQRYPIAGALCHIIPRLIQFLQDGKDTNSMFNSLTSTMSFQLSLLYSTPAVFSSEPASRHAALSALATIAFQSQGQVSYAFPTLLVLLHIVRESTSSIDTLVHVLLHVLPSMAKTNDPVTTSKILQIVLSVIYGTSTTVMSVNETFIASIGVRSLLQICYQQPRVWPELKKVLSSWVLRRKSDLTQRARTPSQTQMEMALLTTMRDLCCNNPKECGQDILPMVTSLLQSCRDLCLASVTLLVDTINACVSAGFVGPRAIWRLALEFVANHAMSLGHKDTHLLWESLCDFFALAGDHDEVSEPYIEFKETLLHTFLGPLIVSSSKRTRSAGLRTLAHFSATDVLSLLPEKPKDVLAQIDTFDTVDQDFSGVLSNLVAHELDHMSRSLYSDDTKGSYTTELPMHQETLSKRTMGVKEAQVGQRMFSAWENAQIAPGLRKGYALAVLCTVSSVVDRKDAIAIPGGDITRARWFRWMRTSIDEMALNDHLLLRVSVVGAWTTFFTEILSKTDANVEQLGPTVMKHLVERLEKSTVPGITCNLLLCITGLVKALLKVAPSCAMAQASEFTSMICDQRKLNNLASEEVAFATQMALGHMAESLATNDRMASGLLKSLVDTATEQVTSPGDLNVDVNLSRFASGFAAGRFTAILATWPTKTKMIDNLAHESTQTLLTYCKDSNASESKVLGILMGYASSMQGQPVADICQFASDSLSAFTRGDTLHRGRLLGSAWVSGYSAVDHLGKTDRQRLDLLEKTVRLIVENPEMALYSFHVEVPYAYLIRVWLSTSDEAQDESGEYYKTLFDNGLQTIHYDDPTSPHLSSALFKIGTLLGADFLHAPPDLGRLSCEAQMYSAEARRPIWDVLLAAAGLDCDETIGNPRIHRLTAVVCGHMVQTGAMMTQAMAHGTTSQGQRQLPVIGISTNEPQSYSRLNKNASFLRAVFDTCVQLSKDTSTVTKVESLAMAMLSTLIETPGPLPSVNWFDLLTRLATVSPSLRRQCLRFASTHCGTSQSLAEYIVSELDVRTMDLSDKALVELLVGETGLGRILELGGLPGGVTKGKPSRRGTDAVTTKANIAGLRLVQIVEQFLSTLLRCSTDIQTLFFATLDCHMSFSQRSDEGSTTELIKSLRDLIRYQVTFRLLDEARLQEIASSVVVGAIENSIDTMEELLRDVPLSTWLQTGNTRTKILSLATVCQSKCVDNGPRWITDAATELLLGQDKVDERCLDILVEAMHQVAGINSTGWSLRAFDVLIVVTGRVNPTAKANSVRHGMVNFLWRVLQQPNKAVSQTPTFAVMNDTAFLIAQTIQRAPEQEQQQILKRLFKLIDLTASKESSTSTQAMWVDALRLLPPHLLKGVSQWEKRAGI